MKKSTKKGKRKSDKRKLAIYQANPLIQARKHYRIMEHRLFRLAIADVRPKLKNSLYYDEDFRPFHMDTAELLEMFQSEGMEINGIYTRLRESCKNMFDSHFEIGDGKDFELCHVFEKIKFIAKSGLDIQFHKDMKKHLLNLEHGNYTISFLKISFSLSSTYALILLELMLQYRGMQKDGIIQRDLSVEEIRFFLNIPDKAYVGRMNNFRKRVVDAAIREINEKTEYHLEPSYGILRGQNNQVIGFHFVLHLPEKEEQEIPVLSEGLEERLARYGIDRDTAKRLSQMPHAEECLQIAIGNILKRKVKNPAAYIRASIEKNWYEARESMKKALEEEKKERLDKMKWNAEAAGKSHEGFMDKEGTSPEQQRASLEEIASGDSPFSELAKKILKKRNRRNK